MSKKTNVKTLDWTPINKKDLLKNRLDTLRPHQLEAFNYMQNNDILQLRYPCSFGKGYLMITDIINQIVKTNNSVFVICSHRLGLNDQHTQSLFDELKPLAGEVAFLFVGSKGGLCEADQNARDDFEYQKYLFKYNKYKNYSSIDRLTFKKLVLQTTKKRDINNFINEHITHRKIVIVSTYNSINNLSDIEIDAIYCDEAHELAANSFVSKNPNSFINKYKSLNCNRRFFFSATPKESSDSTDPIESCLMDNEALFGKKIGMSHVEAEKYGYSVGIDVHWIYPDNFAAEHNRDWDSYQNKAKLILDGFNSHVEHQNITSHYPNDSQKVMLVRASSVEKELWPIFMKLEDITVGIYLFGCASKDRNGLTESNNFMYYRESFDVEPSTKRFKNRKDFIDAINNCEGNAIVLHHDTLSEGINIHKFTCFMPFTDKEMTVAKFIQNLGRILRLNPIDRDKFYKNKIKIGKFGWIKPRANVILPVWTSSSSEIKDAYILILHKLVYDLNAKFGNNIPFGDDKATGRNDEEDNDILDTIKFTNKNPIAETIIKEINMEAFYKQYNLLKMSEVKNACKDDNLKYDFIKKSLDSVK